ncbi:MAG: GntR family transcriptional regulator [Actinomycetota bacterium]|nr:GntR family transcriptional regulator [Actinomycetota bacterium]
MTPSEAADRLGALDRVTLSRTTMAEQILDVLRGQILGGKLRPGTPLREITLAEKFDVSRNTVREAIRLLVNEGLVRQDMHRSAEVTQHTLADLRDILRARATLELSAADALGRASDEQLAGLGRCVALMQRAVDAQDGNAAVEADLAFHRGLVALLGSSRLDRFYEGLQRELRLGLATLDRQVPYQGKVREHRQLAELAAGRDADGLRAAVAAHLEETEAELVSLVGERGAPVRR